MFPFPASSFLLKSFDFNFQLLSLSFVDSVVLNCCLFKLFVLSFKPVTSFSQLYVFVEKLVMFVSCSTHLLLSNRSDFFSMFPFYLD